MSFAETLRTVRRRKKLSMFAAAELAGIAAPIYRMIEVGRIFPDQEKLTALCEALELSWTVDDDDGY